MQNIHIKTLTSSRVVNFWPPNNFRGSCGGLHKNWLGISKNFLVNFLPIFFGLFSLNLEPCVSEISNCYPFYSYQVLATFCVSLHVLMLVSTKFGWDFLNFDFGQSYWKFIYFLHCRQLSMAKPYIVNRITKFRHISRTHIGYFLTYTVQYHLGSIGALAKFWNLHFLNSTPSYEAIANKRVCRLLVLNPIKVGWGFFEILSFVF